MAELQAAMPQLPLTPGMRVQFEAVDPTTGAAVAGVKVSDAVIYADDAATETAVKFTSPPNLLSYAPGTGA